MKALDELLTVLAEDPPNRSGQHKIKKLAGVKSGEGQCRRKMRMSGLCKVEMSGFILGGRRDGNGADRVERERTGAVEGAAPSG
ncbi:MAG: hypothetical protein P4L00_02220, partial [Candidatus Acidoferrales bacterium]|nr:hypothetical protein [Candidatus Acidoferrales bacterium]